MKTQIKFHSIVLFIALSCSSLFAGGGDCSGYYDYQEINITGSLTGADSILDANYHAGIHLVWNIDLGIFG